MSDNLDERIKNAASNNMRVEYKIPNIITYVIAFTKTYEEYCHTSLPELEIIDKVGEKLGIAHPFTGKLSSYLLEEPILNEIEHMSEVQRELLRMLAAGYVLSVIEDYNEGKCIEKGKEKDILSEYLYKFIKSEIISKQREGLFYRRIY
ncbi:Uncharacterized protein Nst1_273 [Candidatus Nanobsidianus stetteri]|uniref:Uncharacterized protein n=1 Tax=Nanobsidianus stetteri TaxID=1294122 RepID=R1E4I6_NANST|nr:Uncharacterized protein Nst1_273 [Candidatus Nanobsidianus stetteri]